MFTVVSMSEFLNKIIEHKHKLNKSKEVFFSSLKEKVSSTKFNRYRLFKKQISQAGQINLIAEIKKASPSKGVLRSEFDLKQIAKVYSDQNVAAISVLTEEKYFLGKPEYVKHVSDTYNVPVLTKDFIVDAGQIYEAFYNGASAVLLIAAILTDRALNHFLKVASLLDIDCLVEVHNKEELERVLQTEAEIIGINNRNLRTFEVDLKTSEQLIPDIPKGKIIVSESGISKHEDILNLRALGCHAVLIGETFMRAEDIKNKIDEIMNG